ncbi:MAG: hypothetical protein A2511_02295 [Deltaproteobacteria bacterium RIFOXYD12_FULL_50_9]|nr:MAG: hypothetical protein A2511_02295 [Deltaproteobacteria bacterium RIFOXYD12_FULL_50_9]
MALKKEYEGKDMEEAINNACTAMNTSRELLNIEVLSTGSQGIFGLCRKMARILVSKKDLPGNGNEKAPSRKSRKPETSEAPSVKVKPPVQKRQAETQEKVQQPQATSQEPLILAPEVLIAIQEDVVNLLKLMGMSVQVTVTQEENKVKALVTGDDVESIVGPEGQTLDGLQYLMRKIVTRKFPEKITFIIDAGEFREVRKSELESQALQLAQEVKDTGKTKTIPALNPAERRIIHMVLQNDTTIRSRSVGDGLFKKILIYLPGKGKKKPTSPRKKESRERQESAPD